MWKFTLYSLLFSIPILLIAAHSLGSSPVPTSTPGGEDGWVSSRPRELVIAAASSLTFALKEVATKFEEETGTRVKLSLGSSGNLYAQMANGAPFDLFLSADAEYPRKLVEAGVVQPESLSIYAVGRIVIWVPKSSPIDVGKLGIESLLHPAVRKIAIANPAHAPYGKGAAAALEHYNLYERLRPKLVLGEDVAQAAQFVQSGAADIGIIALSQAVAGPMREMGSYWEVPLDAYPQLEQAAVIKAQGEGLTTAKRFLQYLSGPAGKDVMQRYGFDVPAAAAP